MVVEVRFFASLVDRVDGPSQTVELDPGTDVAGLWKKLVQRYPGLGDIPYRPMVACDRVYADWERKLEGVREVAFLPPVSGG
jgi:molybdopterin converting factor small subunit